MVEKDNQRKINYSLAAGGFADQMVWHPLQRGI